MSADTLTSTVAVCHEWVASQSGSEQVASRIVEALGARDIYAFVADPLIAERVFPGRSVRASRLNRWTILRTRRQWFLPLMSRWWKSLDLSAYNIVVTSSHSTVNSICVSPQALHICYCHTPMRYAWFWRRERGRLPKVLRPVWPLIAMLLRRTDRRRSKNVDLFLANSNEVAGRIDRFYGRPSIVVYPPVDTRFFTPDATVQKEDFFLYAGRLVAYKRPDIAVEAATRAGVRMIVAGSGRQLERLREIAGPTVEFRVDPSNEDLRDLYRRARALVFPGTEDFGIVMIEAQACGTPVIAHAQGGATEAVIDGTTGLLYKDPCARKLADTLAAFDPGSYDPEVVRCHAERFGIDRFDEAIRRIVGKLI